MPPGRPRSFNADEALDSAMRLFWRTGYRGTTTRDLERHLGVRQASLYKAFGSKADFAALAIERYVDRVDRELLELLRAGFGGLAAIDRFLASLGEWLTADGVRGCLVGRLMSEGDAEPAVSERVTDYRRRLADALGVALRRAAECGEIDPDTIAPRTELLRTAVLGLNLAVVGGASAADVSRMVDAVRGEVARWAGAPHVPAPTD